MTIFPPSREELCDELSRLLDSKVFAASRRSQQLLEYFVNQLLLGTADQVKEYASAWMCSASPRRSTLSLTLSCATRSGGCAASYRPITTARARVIPAHRFPVAFLGACSPIPVGGNPIRDEVEPVHLLRRVAVLPFVAIGPQDEAFNDGLATEVMVRLGARSDLQIISRTSSFAFKGRTAMCARSRPSWTPICWWRAPCRWGLRPARHHAPDRRGQRRTHSLGHL